MIRIRCCLLIAREQAIVVNATPAPMFSRRPEREHVISAMTAFQRVVVELLACVPRLLPFQVLDGFKATRLATKRALNLVYRENDPRCPRPFPQIPPIHENPPDSVRQLSLRLNEIVIST